MIFLWFSISFSLKLRGKDLCYFPNNATNKWMKMNKVHILFRKQVEMGGLQVRGYHTNDSQLNPHLFE